MTDEQFAELMQAIQHQTDAINRLADTNSALIQALAEAEGLDEDQEPTIYLDGTQA